MSARAERRAEAGAGLIFDVKLALGNDAMRSRWDVFEAIRKAILRDEDGPHPVPALGPLERGDEGIVRDENGNTVGSWKVS